MDDYKKIFRKQLIVELSIALAVLSLLGVSIWFLRLHIEQSVSQIVEVRQGIASATANMEALLLLREQYVEFGEESMEALESYVPEREKMFAFEDRIGNLASARGLGMGMSFRQEREASEDDFGFLQYDITVSGDNVGSIISFFDDIRNKGDLVTILGNIDIERTDSGVRALTTIRGYFR